MVFFTMFATIDSLTLLVAMSGAMCSSMGSLKAIADLEHDLVNSADFFATMKLAQKVEYAFLVLNVLACAPFMLTWWLAIPQAIWGIIKAARLATSTKLEEQDIFKSSVYQHHRKWHTAGFFFYLISWFIYFARAVTAIMDIHVHGISPYD
mmetsp:Transcript_69338/g.224160  ORF Transcript_69338/g.224160 Transcript_69338/m.224160 type:complete len:151 (-) Transcript_69338:89-541(-)